MEIEVWKDIPDYDGLYQVSNFGNVKSLDRFIKARGNGVRFLMSKKLNKCISSEGYYYVSLSKFNRNKRFKVHQLVAICFLDHTPCNHKLVIDHIDCNKLNNKLSNIQIVTNRYNCSKDRKSNNSKYIGVSWHSIGKKYVSYLKYGGKNRNLGLFLLEEDAGNAYNFVLNNLPNDGVYTHDLNNNQWKELLSDIGYYDFIKKVNQ